MMFGHDNANQDEVNAQGAQPDNGLTQPSSDSQPMSAPVVAPITTPPSDNGANVSVEGSNNEMPSITPIHPPSESGAPAAPLTNSDDLLTIKQEALSQLSPLVGHLDQTPEEKFRTTMMMIQAADNHALIKTAYQAAKEISDEKSRAQALLDIVNEINYFTQQQQDEDSQAA